MLVAVCREICPIDYLQLLPLGVLLTLLMIVAFLIEPETATDILQHHHKRLGAAFRKHSRYLLYVILGILVALTLGGNKVIQLFQKLDVFAQLFWLAGELAIVLLLVWFVAYLIRAASELHQDLERAMRSWAFCLRTSVVFYIFLGIATYLQVKLDGIKPEARPE